MFFEAEELDCLDKDVAWAYDFLCWVLAFFFEVFWQLINFFLWFSWNWRGNGGNKCEFYHFLSFVIVQDFGNLRGKFGTDLASKSSVRVVHIETVPV